MVHRMLQAAADAGCHLALLSRSPCMRARTPAALQNVLLTEHGRAKVADVGLARMIPATQSYLSGGNGARLGGHVNWTLPAARLPLCPSTATAGMQVTGQLQQAAGTVAHPMRPLVGRPAAIT